MFQFFLLLLRASAIVGVGRLLKGRRRTTWTWSQEALVEAMRANGRAMMGMSPAEARKRIESMAASSTATKRVVSEAVDVDGLKGEWLTPSGKAIEEIGEFIQTRVKPRSGRIV